MAQFEEEEPTLFMVSALVLSNVPNFDFESTEVINDSVIALVSVEPEKEL